MSTKKPRHGASAAGEAARPSAPRAEIRPHVIHRHGIELVDPYAWLRADNWQEVMRDPDLLAGDIRSHLEAENAHTVVTLADTGDLGDVLYEEMKGRIREDDSTVPEPDGPWQYYTRHVVDGEYPIVCRRPLEGGEEQVLIDGDEEADDEDYWDLGDVSHSPDHKLLAYAVDDKGSELYTIRVRDLITGEDLDDEVPNARDTVVWANDSRTLFYVRLDDNHRPLTVCRHVLGTPVEEDVVVYEEKDIGFYVDLEQTQSGKLICIDVHDHQTNEVWLIEADAPAAPIRLVAARQHGHEYSLEHRPGPEGDVLIIATNSSGAEDFRICETPLADPSMGNWRELIPHRPGCLILEAVAFAEHSVRLERESGLPRIVIRRWSDGAEHVIAFDEEAYSLGMWSGFEFETRTLRFTYSSMTTPRETWDYDMETRQRVLRKRQEVPSGHDPADYVTRRVHAPATDGETVPVSLLYHKDTPLDGTAPLLLYGYGSYGISISASFSTARLSLVDRGFVYAIAHVRGGKDKGYRWYTGGKLATKTNTFTDFIAAGEYLAGTRVTSRGRIVANGGSAGGMLMGVVANLAPDLFLGIIADVPFVDVLNTMLDDTLPLTPPEWPEWGNPITSKEEFERILSWSPYENVAAKAYPHIYAYGGLTDPRVTYWEPAKWVAKLRAMKTDDNLLLLHTNMDGGHGGASGRFEQLEETAQDYVFALKIAGLVDAVPRPSSARIAEIA